MAWLDVTTRSLGVAFLATLLTLCVATPLGYVLSRRDFWGKRLVSALGMLPLVLPPTAVGTLLLALLAENGPFGATTMGFDLGVLFTWKAAVIASAVMSFPLVLRTTRLTFDGIDPRLEGMAQSLGHTPLASIAKVTLPLAKRGLVAAAILGFLRALGEYGATAMIAGNIPGKTQTIALAIESAQAAGHVEEALVLTVLAVALGVSCLVLSEHLLDESPRRGARRVQSDPVGLPFGAKPMTRTNVET
ncbi:MAG: molybdate ABC transporter permease subunit [Polyangiaceae bacterium]